MKRSALVLAVVAFLFAATNLIAAPLISNGGFEAGFTGWTITNQAGGSGNWFIQSGAFSPNGFSVPVPPGPTHAAMSDTGGPGSHVLIQSFVVPAGVTSATLSFDEFIGNRGASFASPNTLDFTAFPNQQARVDILTGSASPFSVAPADVLLNVFQTNPGDPLVSGYTTQSVDLSAFLAAHAGQTLQLRFSEVDNLGVFNFGVDNVSLQATVAVPEPASIAVFGALIVGGAAFRLRRFKQAA
ncbi:MAG TPA: PEP-CTERM sorting domain-containing protein [Gemmataceae bacterium]|nr:PEP-CTERM sorting domain-containing protein [Gemmataceae bacterium]